jgi:cyclopropane-fatty-acyl-phospholipid synthase
VRLYDDRFFRLWLFYLAAAMTMFSDSGMVNYQIQYVRRRDALPITRNFMFEAENRLLAIPDESRTAPRWTRSKA